MDNNITFTHREEVSKVVIFIEYFILALAFLIIIPAGVLIVTKDTLPGESLYPYKIQIESAGSSLFKGSSFKITFEKMILGRRFFEGMELYKKGRSDAFDPFVKKMGELTDLILKEPDLVKRSKVSLEFINRLQGYKSTISEGVSAQDKMAISVSAVGEIDKALVLLKGGFGGN